MLRRLILFLVFGSGLAYGQLLTCTNTSLSSSPNLAFQLPVTNACNWGPPVNANFTALDLLLSGHANLTALAFTNGTISGSISFSGAITLSGITGTVQCLHVSTAGLVSGTGVDCGAGGGGGGTVTTVSDLAPLFTTATRTTTPAFSLTAAAAHAVFGNNTSGSAAPVYFVPACADLSNAGAFCSGTAYSSLTGTPQLPVTLANASHKWFNSYSSVTGLFTQTQPDYTDLTSLPQLAVTKTAVASNWLRSYDSATGLFTASQPAFSDVSSTASDAQLANAYSGVGTPTACTNQFVTGLTLTRNAAPTSACTTDVLASAQHANQGTTTTVLHGNAAGNPAFGAVVQADVTNGYVDLSSNQTVAGNKTLSGVTTVANTNKRIYVDQAAGAEVGAKCTAATTTLGVGGGILDFTGFQGAQTWTTTCNVQSNTTYVLPPASAATFTMSGISSGLLGSGTSNTTVQGGLFVLSGDGLSSGNAGMMAIQFTGTGKNNSVTGATIVGDTASPTVFTITSIQRTTNVITVAYTGSAGLIVGQYVSITGVTSDVTMNFEGPVASQSAGTFTIASTGTNAGPFVQGQFQFFPKYALSTVQRTTNVVTATYAGNANLVVGQGIIIMDVVGDSVNNPGLYCQIVTQSAGNFTCSQTGANAGPFSVGNFQVANQQYGIIVTGTQSDATINLNNISNVTWGIGCGTSGTDTILGCLVQGNDLNNIPGHGTGSGYGVTGQNSGSGRYRIMQNNFVCVGRHAIYTGEGAGHLISGNHVFNHGCGIPANDAFEIGRQADASVVNNEFDTTYGHAIDIFAGASAGSGGQLFMRNITVVGNNFKDTYPAYSDIVVFAENSSVDVPQDITIASNVHRRTGVGTASVAAAGIDIEYGKRVNITGEIISYDGVTSNGRGITLNCTGETAGTASFSDRIRIQNTQIRTAGSSDVGMYISGNCSPSTVVMDFSNNRIDSGTQVFVSGAQTDPNIMFCNSPLGNASITLATTCANAKSDTNILNFPEMAAPSGVAGKDVVYGDSTAHALKGSYNNSAFSNIPLTGLTNVFSVSQTFTAGLQTGASPPACTAGTAGFMCNTEGTAPTNVASTATIYPSSTTHEYMAVTNGASTATPGMMVRSQPGALSHIGSTATISTETVCAASAGACNVAGQYHVHLDMWESGTACSSITAGSVAPTLTWTDRNGTSHAAVPFRLITQASGTAFAATFIPVVSALTAFASADMDISTNGTVIQDAFTYIACTTGTLTYNADVSVTRYQ